MNEKQNRFIVSVATKNVLVFVFFVVVVVFFNYYFKKYPGHARNLFTVVSYRG